MSFTSSKTAHGFAAGFFLAGGDESCVRVTKTVSASHAQAKTTAEGTKYVPAGAVIPANGSTAVGILYEDVDVTNGAAPGSVVIEGRVYEDRLPATVESAAKSAMAGIEFVTAAPTVERPAIFGKFDALDVESEEGSASGKTAITVSGHTLAAGESYAYKTASAVALPALGDDLSAWTSWDGSSDITATTGNKIAIAVVNSHDEAVAAGVATVASKA